MSKIHPPPNPTPPVSFPSSLFSRISHTLSILNPLPNVGRAIFLALLSKLQIGHITLTLTYDGNATFSFGPNSTTSVPLSDPFTPYHSLNATLYIHSSNLWSRLVTSGDMGFAEGYMEQEVDVDNMMTFLMIMVKNKPFFEDTSNPLAVATEIIDYLSHTRLANTIKNSLSNISAHYDLSNEMFAAFLDNRMQYSCAIWDWSFPDTLETAQLRKITTILNKAKLTSNSRVLEIGTGWGGLAVEAVKQSGGCSVVTITLSVEQKLLAENRIRQAERSGDIPCGRIQVLLCDYRKLPERFPDGHFDTIISIEMIEAVGKEYLDAYFNVCHRMLHLTRGIMVLQVITMPETRAAQYSRKADFIQKYIFPGGFLPSITQLVDAVHNGTQGGLIVQHMENFATHYARTLQVWRSNFVNTYPTVTKAAMATSLTSTVAAMEDDIDLASDQTYTSLTEIEGVRRRAEIGTDQFCRKFLYYFDYCSAGFATRVIDLHQIVLSREGCERLLDGPFALGNVTYIPASVDS